MSDMTGQLQPPPADPTDHAYWDRQRAIQQVLAAQRARDN